MEAARLCFACGLCAFVPLPWLDAYAERKVRRRLYQELAAARGVTLDEAVLDTLTEDRTSLLAGCLVGIVVWPVKKLFRTFFYFLTIKDVIDGVAHAGVCAAMVDAALERGALPGRADEVRVQIDQTLARHRWSPITRLLTGGERPPATWLGGGGDPLADAVAWLYRHAGGGHLLAFFTTRLEARG